MMSCLTILSLGVRPLECRLLVQDVSIGDTGGFTDNAGVCVGEVGGVGGFRRR